MQEDLQALRREVERAAAEYYHSTQQLGIDNRTRRLVIEDCLPFVRGPRVLELGYVDGLWTRELLAAGCCVDVVEGAFRHIQHAESTFAGDRRVQIHHKLFQEFEPQWTYSTVLAGDMIRYLADPLGFLRKAAGWLEEDGRLIVTVPNSRSLHRRIGALMELEARPTDANARDREVGNLRSYDRYELRALLREAGWEIDALHGSFLKPLSSNQMTDFSDALLRGLAEIGRELEDYCWFLFAVARRPLGHSSS